MEGFADGEAGQKEGRHGSVAAEAGEDFLLSCSVDQLRRLFEECLHRDEVEVSLVNVRRRSTKLQVVVLIRGQREL